MTRIYYYTHMTCVCSYCVSIVFLSCFYHVMPCFYHVMPCFYYVMPCFYYVMPCFYRDYNETTHVS